MRRAVADRDRLAEATAELVGEAFYTERGFDPWISEAPALFVPCVSAKVYVDRYNEPGAPPDASLFEPKHGRMELIEVKDVLEKVACVF